MKTTTLRAVRRFARRFRAAGMAGIVLFALLLTACGKITVTLPATALVPVGGTIKLEPVVNFDDDDLVKGTKEYQDEYDKARKAVSNTWTSGDAGIASVDENGMVTGVKAGTAVITLVIYSGGKKYDTKTCTVTVVEGSIAAVKLLYDDITLQKGQTRNLDVPVGYEKAADASDADYQAAIAGKAVFTPAEWSSSDSTIASVDASGTVTGVSEGTAVITASYTSLRAVTCTVHVQDPQLSVIAEQTILLTINHTTEQNVNAKFSASTPGEHIAYESDDPEVASVDSSGLVRAHKDGTCTVTSYAVDAGGSRLEHITSAKTAVTVYTAPGKLKAADLSLQVGATQKIRVSTVPETVTYGTDYTFSSADPGIASVSSKGVVTGVAAGTVKITVRNGQGTSTTLTVTVTAPVSEQPAADVPAPTPEPPAPTPEPPAQTPEPTPEEPHMDGPGG